MNRFIIHRTRTTTNNVKHDRINWLINNNNEEEDVQENILPPSTYVLDSLSLSLCLAFILFVSRPFISHLLNAHPYLHTLCCLLMSFPGALAQRCALFHPYVRRIGLELWNETQFKRISLSNWPIYIEKIPRMQPGYNNQVNVAQFTFLMWRKVFGLSVDDARGVFPVTRWHHGRITWPAWWAVGMDGTRILGSLCDIDLVISDTLCK